MTAAARASQSPTADSGVLTLLRSPGLALTLAALFWAGSFIVGRALREEIDPVALTFHRWLVSLLIIVPFAWRDLVQRLPAVLREWRLVLGLGTTGIALFHPLVYVALQHTSATNALLTFSLSPVVILVCTSIGSRKRPAARELAGILTSMSGAAVLITRGDAAALASTGVNIGDVWMLAAVAVWAAYSLLLRRCPADLPQTPALVASIAVALPLLLPLTLLGGAGHVFPLSTSVLLGTAYIAVFGSVIGFLFWSHGVSSLGPSRAGQFVHLMPVFGAALAFVFLGEPLTMAQLLGAGLVLSGIALIEWRSSAAPASGPPADVNRSIDDAPPPLGYARCKTNRRTS